MKFWSRPASRSTLGAMALSVLAGSVGCAEPPILASPLLPVKHVVVYRNGVAYFERSGHVSAEEVQFKMQQGEVADFLATLAVMERGGSSVRSARSTVGGTDPVTVGMPSTV